MNKLPFQIVKDGAQPDRFAARKARVASETTAQPTPQPEPERKPVRQFGKLPNKAKGW